MKKIWIPLLIVEGLLLCSCAVNSILNTSTSREVVAVETTNSYIDRIAREIGYDNYAKGEWTTKDFEYQIELVAQLDTLRYYKVTYKSEIKRSVYYIKVDFDSYEIMRKENAL